MHLVSLRLSRPSLRAFLSQGLFVFQTFFLEASWRRVFRFAMLVNCLFSLLQVALVMRWNEAIGIPDIWFALGDSAVTHFINAVSYMPTLIMVSALYSLSATR